jgi:threonylcarbamoyladenosine tRNA methylthiotransferase MtaB
MHSRPVDDVLDEVRRLVDAGYRELVLTGIHLGHYGVDFNRGLPKDQWLRLSHLMQRIARLPGDFRVRLSSIEATEVTRELVAALAEHPQRFCPHLHVSMQSGSDTVLARMRRRWGSRRFVDRCRLVQQAFDRPALTTDVIVGFPGETEAEFAETCRVVDEVGFSKLHIFPYSARRGTPAAEMPNQVPATVKAERVERLGQLEARSRKRYFESLLGSRLEVLVEGAISQLDREGDPGPQLGGPRGVPTGNIDNRLLVGTACRYAPVSVLAPASLVNELVTVKATTVAVGRNGGDEIVGQWIVR